MALTGEKTGIYSIEVNSLANKLFCKEYIYEINYYRFNWHKTIEVMVILKGQAEVCAGGETYHLHENDILIINANIGHGSFARAEETIAFVFQLDPVYFETIFPGFETIFFSAGHLKDSEYGGLCLSIRHYMARLMSQIYEMDDRRMNADTGLAMLLVSEILKTVPYELNGGSRQGKGEKSRRMIQKILKYTENHYKDKIALDDLARITGYNRTYLSTVFKKTVGLNYYDYLTMLRIRNTLAELNASERSITDIALDYGFPNVNAFAEAFKKNFKQSPSEYRNRLKGESQLKAYLPYRNDISLGHPFVEMRLREFEGGLQVSDGKFCIEGQEDEKKRDETVGDEVRILIKELYDKVNTIK